MVGRTVARTLSEAVAGGPIALRLARRAVRFASAVSPADQEQVSRLLQGGSPEPIPVGACLLLEARPPGRASLWMACPAGPGRVAEGELLASARVARRRLYPLVTEALPRLRGGTLTPPELVLVLLATTPEGEVSTLEGSSLLLPLALGLASHLVGQALPAHVAATGAVDERGWVLPVGGLAEKLGLLRDWAPSVRTVLVASEQVAEAHALGTGHEVVGVRSLGDAIRECLPRAPETEPPPQLAAAELRSLVRAATDGHPGLTGWGGIAASADALKHRMEDPASRRLAGVVGAIARRHTGRAEPLDLEGIELAWPRKVALVAHAVQAVADCASHPDANAVVALAEQYLEEARGFPEELRLLGAVGRMHAAGGAAEPALAVLERAVQGWFALDRTEEATFAVAEALRLCGALQVGQGWAWGAADRVAAEVFGEGAGYVRVAAARSRLALGQPHAALADLADNVHDWALLPRHVSGARQRHLVAAWRATGCATESGWSWLHAHAALPEVALMLRLARLEEAVAGHGSPAEALTALLELERDGLMAGEVERIARNHRLAMDDPGLPGLVVRWYRY